MPNDTLEIKKMCQSTDGRVRENALRLMRSAMEGGTSEGYLDLARAMITDADNDCRWQAVIVVGGYIETHPERVWQVVVEHADSADDDLLDALATVLLEHLLELDFDKYFTKCKAAVTEGHAQLVAMLKRCWAFGEAEMKWGEVSRFIERAKKR